MLLYRSVAEANIGYEIVRRIPWILPSFPYYRLDAIFFKASREKMEPAYWILFSHPRIVVDENVEDRIVEDWRITIRRISCFSNDWFLENSEILVERFLTYFIYLFIKPSTEEFEKL